MRADAVGGFGAGAQAAMGPTVAFAAPIYARLLQAFQKGDYRRSASEQARASEMVETCRRYGLGPSFKAVMAMVGIECGLPRLPMGMLSPAQMTSLRKDLDRIGFLDGISVHHSRPRIPLSSRRIGIPEPALLVE